VSVNQEAFDAYMKISQEIEDSLIAEMGQEAYDASQHWVNNPLISPISKVHNFEEHEKWVRKDQTERIIKLLEDENNDEMSIDYQSYLIALIKGENK
jgi:hypothetical protein